MTSVSGTAHFGGPATLTATLTTASGQVISGVPVSFTLDGAFAGVAVTDSSGVATVSDIPTSDAVGTDTGGVFAYFAGDINVKSSIASGDLTVSEAPAPAMTSADSTTFTTGTAGTFTVTTTGVPTSALSETGTLPSGVTFVDNGDGTATLAGTPAAGTDGTYPLTITADNGVVPDATQSFTLTVAAG